jgi:hypothetical protein
MRRGSVGGDEVHWPADDPGNAARAGVRLIVWCRKCGRQVEPDSADMAARYGAEMPVPEWRERLVCSGRGGPQVDIRVGLLACWRGGSRQLVEQRLCLLQIGGIKALDEPAVDRREEVAPLGAAALLSP